MTTTYAERVIDLTIQLGQGSFGESGADKVTFRGLRIFVDIELALQASPNALIRVYGLSLDRVNQLSRAGLNWEGALNTVLVEAGDEGSQLKSIFEGEIITAAPDFNAMPETSLVLTASGGRLARMKPVKPSSFRGSVSAEEAMKKIVQPAGWTLENKGVQAQLDNPYFPGTAWDQLDRAAQAANCLFCLDTLSKKVTILPKTGDTVSDTIAISPDDGMIGYPEFDRNMIKVRTRFNPELALPKKVEVKSQLKSATGTWNTTSVGHTIESQMPGGPWETHFTAVRAGT
jgi:hypothetical protein